MNKAEIKDTVIKVIKNKLEHYNSNKETDYMPFHHALLGKDKMALFSFIQSFNTSIGTSIYESIAKKIAEINFDTVEIQYKFINNIKQNSQNYIGKIIGELSANSEFDYTKLNNEIKFHAMQDSKMNTLKTVKADIMLMRQNKFYFFDIKTVKPNASDYEKYKQTLCQWLAIHYQDNPNSYAQAMLAIPYNPYHPNPYKRWTMKGMIDLQYEVKIAEEFWDFLGGNGTFEKLIDIFNECGSELKHEIDNFFQKIK